MAPLSVSGLTQRQRILVTRLSIVVIGLLLLLWGLWYEVSSNLWQYMAVTGTVYLSGVFPVVVGGLYWKRSSSVGAYLALLGGLTGILAMGPCVAFLNGYFGSALRSDQIMLSSFAVSLTGFIFGSLLFPDARKQES